MGAFEIEAGDLADRATPAVATDQIGAADAAFACGRRPSHIDAVRMLYQTLHVTFAAHLDPKRAGAIGQHGFNGLLIHRAATPIRLLLRVGSDQDQACEMTGVPGPETPRARFFLR